MEFDVRTLLVAAALATSLCALARILLWRLHPAIPGLGSWAAACVLASVGLGLHALLHIAPSGLALSLPRVLEVVGCVLSWDGFRRFNGRKSPPFSISAAVVLCMLVATTIPSPDSIPKLGAIVNSALISLLSLLIARELLRTTKTVYLTMRVTGWIYILNAAFFAARAFALTQVAPPLGRVALGSASVTLLWWLCGTMALTLGMVLMTSERLKDNLEQQASRDSLTGALNRRAFALMVKKEAARARRSGQPLSVLMMDLDHFKQINDRRGHAGGDAILCLFVSVATRILRGEDLFCRFGGEEFVALLPGSSADAALAAAERLRIAFAEGAGTPSGSIRSRPFAATVSIGVHEMLPGEDLESAVRHADTALYQAKAMGRNRCELAVPATNVTPIPVMTRAFRASAAKR